MQQNEFIHHYTWDEYWKLVETFPNHKYEYVNGYVRMMAGGSPAHGQIAMQIGALLNVALRNSECNVYSSDVAVLLQNDRSYYPDVSVSCDPFDWTRKKALEAPSVVIEVLSPSTEKIDKVEKLDAYQRYPTIQDILLVDVRKKNVEYHKRVDVDQWLKRVFTQEDDVIHLNSISVSLRVGDIYHKVYLEIEEE